MKTFTFICLLVFVMKSFSQQIEKHQWKHRVFLIFSEAKNGVTLKKQLQLLEKDKEGLQERKLIVYSFTKTEFRYQFENEWQKSSEIYEQFVKSNNPFQVFLIGLDGAIKLDTSQLLTLQQLFSTIDRMPMRKRELKIKN